MDMAQEAGQRLRLRIIAAEEGTTVQALLAEGINTVFAKRGKPEIAGLPTVRTV